MSQRNGSAGIEPNVSRSAAYSAFGRALRLYVGRGCRYSYKELQQKSGVAARMIEAYRYATDHEEWRPAPFEDVLSLSGAIGPEFTADWLSLSAQGAFWLPETDDTPPGALAADNADDNAELTRRALDGSFAGDAKALRIVGQRMVARGMKLSAVAA